MPSLSPPDGGSTTPRTSKSVPLFSRLLSYSSQKRQGIPEEQKINNDAGTSQPQSDRLDRMIDSSNDGKCSVSESTCIDDSDSIYDVCETIDSSMLGLHTFLESKEHVKAKDGNRILFDHDWILDGSDSEGDDQLLLSPKTRQRRKFGDAALDQMLGMLEIENASYATSSCSSSLVDGEKSRLRNTNEEEHDVDENDEMIEFADFSKFDTENGDDSDDMGYNMNNTNERPVSVDVSFIEKNLQHDTLYEYDGGDLVEEKSLPTKTTNSIEEVEISGGDITQLQEQDIRSFLEYKPPQSIACLVSNLDAELDVTIGECQERDNLSVVESECSSSQHDGNCADLLDALNEENDLITQQVPQHQQKEYKQPLLMSSLLLESLPVPMPSTSSDDHVASLTRRIQKHHMSSKEKGNRDTNIIHTMQAEDKLLEEKFSDTIHTGYYSSAGDNCDSDYFDSKVLEEVSNVPWPFQEIDLNEPFLNEDSEPDFDESEGIDHLNFDTYIANRLSELDFATGEIMSCALSRVSQKADAINRDVENIYSAELEISAALLFAKSSREFLHGAKNGYPSPNVHIDHTYQHNVVLGGLDVIHYADSKDRLRYLAQTIDQVSSICDQEAQWWRAVNAKMIAPHTFQKLVDDTRRLKELALGEEVLNHSTSLATMRDRINSLPEVLLEQVDESLAELFARVLTSGENAPCDFDEYFFEYDTLLQSWLSCCQLMELSDQYAARKTQLANIGAEWSSRILNIFCFESSKALACSTVDSYYDEGIKRPTGEDHGAIEEIRSILGRMKFDSKDGSDLDSLSQRLLVIRLGGGHHSSALSSTFFHLCSRLVELMNLYDVTVQWHKAIIIKTESSNKPMVGMLEVAGQSKYESNNTMVSSISSDKQSLSSRDDTLLDEQQQATRSVPETLEFQRNSTAEGLDQFKAMLKSMELVRHALWKRCELALISLIEFYLSQCGDLEVQSGDSTDFATSNLRQTYDVLLQFTSFSSYFLSDQDDESKDEDFSALKNGLSALYRRHLRSIHIEAMKTTGTLLRHESWHLAPLQLPGGALEVEASTETIMQAIYEAVGDLILGYARAGKTEHHSLITTRAEDHGYRYCSSFGQFLDRLLPKCSTTSNHDTSRQLSGCYGMTSKEFSSQILSFVEMKPCGERYLSILTQSSANGLLKWATRLLAIGNALPLVADDASAAVMTLFDLYILTVLRFCAGSKSNEDVLFGFGRGAAARSTSPTSISLTMEADSVAPLPREGRVFLNAQMFIRNSRERLESIVNFDKFQSSNEDMCPTSPRSKDDVSNLARRLEKEVAAACSCFFAAILVDVACKLFDEGKCQPSWQKPLWVDLKDTTTTIEENSDGFGAKKEDSLETYAIAVVTIIPTLVTQTSRFATVNSISGKDLIFQIICCGRVWENHSMQEQSNAYVDNLCERSAFLWGYMSSSMRLPSPVLQYTWNHLVRSAFMVLLEGFSKVPKCSTEGRSLMSMDLATLFHGFTPETVQAEIEDDYSNVGPPPRACREEMMRYVDTFIKVFYFPDEDIINWIKDNSRNYHLDHTLSLVTSKASGSKDKSFITNGKKSVGDIYDKLRIIK